MRRTLFLLALLGLVGSAAALPVEGTLTAEGPFTLPPGATLRAAPEALLQNDTSGLPALSLVAPALRLTVYELPRLKPTAGGLSPTAIPTRLAPEAREYRLRNVTLALAEGDASGFLGVYPGSASRLEWTTTQSAEITPRNYSSVSWRESVGGKDRPDSFGYTTEIERAHLYLSAPGKVVFTGAGAVKINGPNVRVTSDRGNLSIETGEVQTSPVEWAWRWAYLDFPDATLEWDSDTAPVEVASRGTDATWEGVVTLKARSGRLRADGADYVADGASRAFEGRFTGTLEARAQGAEIVTLVRVRGDLGDTDLSADAAHKTVPLHGNAAFPWLTFLLGATLAGGAVYAAPRVARRLHVSRKAHRDEMTVEGMASLAHEAMEAGDWRIALTWFRRIRQLVPTSLRVRLDAAYCLCEIGDLEEALKEYRDAAKESAEDGEADLWTALLLVELARDVGEAETHFEEALRKSPDMVEDAETKREEFGRFLDRPRVRRAIREARRRLGDDGEPSGGVHIGR